MQFDELPEFQKDLKQLQKKFRSLKEDLEVLKKVLATEGVNHPQPPLSFRIPGIGFEKPSIVKIKKFACRSLKGRGANTGFRVIYAYHQEEQLIQFIELYFKADDENEDRDRILKYFGENEQA
jgi:mRNA-degrading endonuclease RelE of RelBE toxin-antitoxin system